MNEQIELDKITAKEALTHYLKNFLIPERTIMLEGLICELDKEDVINTVKLTKVLYVGDKELYSTYKEHHIRFIEVNGTMLYLFV